MTKKQQITPTFTSSHAPDKVPVFSNPAFVPPTPSHVEEEEPPGRVILGWKELKAAWREFRETVEIK